MRKVLRFVKPRGLTGACRMGIVYTSLRAEGRTAVCPLEEVRRGFLKGAKSWVHKEHWSRDEEFGFVLRVIHATSGEGFQTLQP